MIKSFPRKEAAWILLAVYLPLILTLELLHNHGAETHSAASLVCCCQNNSAQSDQESSLNSSSDVCPACQFALMHAASGETSIPCEFSPESIDLPPIAEFRYSTPLCASQRAPPQA